MGISRQRPARVSRLETNWAPYSHILFFMASSLQDPRLSQETIGTLTLEQGAFSPDGDSHHWGFDSDPTVEKPDQGQPKWEAVYSCKDRSSKYPY